MYAKNKIYFTSHSKKNFSGLQDQMFEQLSNLNNCEIPTKHHHKVIKVLMLCFLGSFFGHHTLKEILTAYGIKNTNVYKHFNRLSYKDLSSISLQLFSHFVAEQLIELGNQSESSWSRACPTFVIDSSVFKQWLKDNNCEFFDKYFSGQTGKPEYGFRLTLGGIAISDTFYPLIFNILPKHIPDAEIASTMLLQMYDIVNKIANQNKLTFGTWYLSVDNGYSDNILLDTSTTSKIIPICVPKKSHIFIINNKPVKLKDYIENEFIPKEIEFHKTHPDEDYTERIKVKYKALDKDVVLFIFRYKDSKKVSVIYSTNLEIKGKTLRHHWFQRTYIEQFFRFSKHTLKIAQSTYDNINDFVRKICLNFMKTIFCLIVRNQFRKNYRYFKDWTFGTISLHIRTYRTCENWLKKLIKLQEAF